jgi:hypothetical protein
VRRAVLAAVVAAPVAGCLWLALGDPEVRFLAPGRGAWLVDPRWEIRRYADEQFPSTRFRLQLPLAERPGRFPVAVTVLGGFRLEVNGWPVHDLDEADRRRPVALDLAPWLRAGDNAVEVLVRTRAGPAPLRVAGEGAGAAATTGRAPWLAATAGRKWVAALAAGGGEQEYRDKGLPLRARAAVAVALAAVAALGFWGLSAGGGRTAFADGPPLSPPPLPAPASRRRRALRWLRRHRAPLAALALVAAASLWNAWRFPFRRAHLDRTGHVEHIRHATRTWRPALAHEGWQMYQPPLYYRLAGAAYASAGGDARPQASLRRVQRLGGWVGVLHALVAFALLARLGPESGRTRALALLAAGLAPAALTTGAMISNEPLAGLLAGLPLAAGAIWLGRGGAGGGVGPGRGLVLGVLCGLALLT